MKYKLYHTSNIIIALFLMVILHISCSAKKPDSRELSYKENISEKIRALSLNSIAYHCEQNISADVIRFFGITQIIGYVIDDVRNDLILIGEVNPLRPPIYFEDFIVALRNAWRLYYIQEDGIRYYSTPGCSIDPDPEIIGKLQEIGNRINDSHQPEMISDQIQQWKSICGQLQQVRVLGIPFETRFAKVMVDADYLMKSIVDGSLNLDIDGFSSLTDMRINIAKGNRLSNGRSQSLNRFWFYPSVVEIFYSDGIKIINKANVLLLTEEEYLTNEGKIQGTGNIDTLAKKFAAKFSELYNDIAKRKSVYTDLENLFRLVALTTSIYSDETIKNGNIELDYFLNNYLIKSTFVNRNLPGRSNVKQLSLTDKTNNGVIKYYYWFPTCGGVNIDVKIKNVKTSTDNANNIKTIREIILTSKPKSADMYWDVSIK